VKKWLIVRWLQSARAERLCHVNSLQPTVAQALSP